MATWPLPEEDPDDVAAALGLPPDTTPYVRRVAGPWLPRGWRKTEYQVEMLGVVERVAYPLRQPTMPHWVLWLDDGMRTGCVLWVWRYRVVEGRGRVFLEVVSRPGQAQSVAVRGVEAARRPQEVLAAWRGLRLLRRLRAAGGRPLGSGTFRDADDFRRAVGKAVRAIHSQGVHPSEVRVAEYLAARPKLLRRAPTGRERPDAESVERSLRAWLGRYGYVSWQAFLDDVLTG